MVVEEGGKEQEEKYDGGVRERSNDRMKVGIKREKNVGRSEGEKKGRKEGRKEGWEKGKKKGRQKGREKDRKEDRKEGRKHDRKLGCKRRNGNTKKNSEKVK